MSGFLRPPGEQSWASVLVDVGVVVVGVIIAFGLNSWWSNRNAEQRRRAHLRALEADLERNRAVLEDEIRARRQLLENTRSLFDLLRAEGQPSRDTVVALLQEIYVSSQYEPVLGAYENLINSGGLSQLGSPKLQARLASLVVNLRNNYSRRLETQSYFNLTREFPSVVGHLPRAGEGPPAVHSSRSRGLDALVSDPEFQSLLFARMASVQSVESRLTNLKQQVAEVLKQVRRELGKPGSEDGDSIRLGS